MSSKYAICLLSVIPVRSEASDKVEMVTQVLFGELLRIKGVGEKWSKIETVYDNYEGWIDNKQYTFITEQEFYNLADRFTGVSEGAFSKVIDNKGNTLLLPMGSSLPNELSFSIGDKTFHIEGNVYHNNGASRKDIISTALQYKGAPYLWGGRTPLGIDCSGFTQMVYKYNSIVLLRDASQQITQAVDIGFLDDALPGDLLFFDNQEGRITHVGILLEKDKIIHASGEVRIDTIDSEGIFNEDKQQYTHHLCFVGRII